MTLKFSAHGKTECSVKDNIIIIKSKGPWNIEYFASLHVDIIKAIKENSLQNFSVLLIPYGEAVGVHEALTYHVDFLRKGTTNAIAIDLSCTDTPLITESLCRTAYEAAGFEHEFFSDREQAISWLKIKNKNKGI